VDSLDRDVAVAVADRFDVQEPGRVFEPDFASEAHEWLGAVVEDLVAIAERRPSLRVDVDVEAAVKFHDVVGRWSLASEIEQTVGQKRVGWLGVVLEYLCQQLQGYVECSTELRSL